MINENDRDVHVRGYVKADGTQVSDYDRSAPERGADSK